MYRDNHFLFKKNTIKLKTSPHTFDTYFELSTVQKVFIKIEWKK